MRCRQLHAAPALTAAPAPLPPTRPAGILFRESLAASAGLSLLASGVCDALSAGILIYVALVSMITPQFTDSEWLRRAPGAVRGAAFAALYSGAAVMALIGKWV